MRETPTYATIEVTFGALAISAGSNDVAVSGSGTAQVVLTGSVAAINALLGGSGGSTVMYFAGAAAPPAGAELTLTVNDLGNSSSGGPLTAQAAVSIQIVSAPPLPWVSVSGQSVSESNGLLTFTITLSQASAANVTVDWSILDGTAARPDDYGYLYVPGAGTL